MKPRSFESLFVYPEGSVRGGERCSAEIVAVQGKPYIFSDIRIDRDSIPEGFSAYDVADDGCDGEFWIVKPSVIVNYWCTIIGKEPIEYNDNFKYWCPPEEGNDDVSSEGNFIGDYVFSVEEYIKRYDELKMKAS